MRLQVGGVQPKCLRHSQPSLTGYFSSPGYGSK